MLYVMNSVTSLCKAGVEITSSFLFGLRIIRITKAEVSKGVNGVCSPKGLSLTSNNTGDKGVLSQRTGRLGNPRENWRRAGREARLGHRLQSLLSS